MYDRLCSQLVQSFVFCLKKPLTFGNQVSGSDRCDDISSLFGQMRIPLRKGIGVSADFTSALIGIFSNELGTHPRDAYTRP